MLWSWKEGSGSRERRVIYLDSSAIVKFILPELESEALLEHLSGWPERISSAVARVEVFRAIRRAGAMEQVHQRAEDVIARISLVRLDGEVLGGAAKLEPRDLRSLDAIHLATALSVPELSGMICYDERLTEAAISAGIDVVSPGREE